MVGHRRTDKYCGGSDTCGDEDSRIERIIRVLDGCEVVLCARIGYEPWSRLETAGIKPDAEYAMEPIEEAVMAVWRRMLAAGKLSSPRASGRCA